MSRRWIIILVAAALVVVATYVSLRVVWVLGRAGVGLRNRSRTEADSRSGGFYLGTYIPAQRIIPLRDGSVIHLPDAWVERPWTPRLTWLLHDRKVTADGYYFCIPIHPDESTRSKAIWPFKFGLDLDQQERQISQHPGIGYNPDRGFDVFLDSLPETVKFIVNQKEHEEDTWNRAVPVGTIEFKRAF